MYPVQLLDSEASGEEVGGGESEAISIHHHIESRQGKTTSTNTGSEKKKSWNPEKHTGGRAGEDE